MEEKIGYKDILHQKEYLKMIMAALINRFGDSVEAIAFTWIVYEITRNASWSAMIYGLNLLPTILVTPFAGAWVEGRRKKPIMVVTDLIRAVCVAFIATAYLNGFLQAWMLACTTVVISTAEAFRGPANIALTPQVLKKEYYDYGMSMMNSLSNIVEIIGMALAAGLIALIGNAGVIYLDMITFLLSAAIILFVRVEKTLTEEKESEEKGAEKESYWKTLISGFRYVAHKKLILFFLGVAIFLNAILTPINSLEAPFAQEILGAGVEALSAISISLTVGMLLASAAYPKIREHCKGKILIFGAGIGIGIYYLGILAARPLYGNKIFMYVFIVVMSGLLGFFITLMSSFTSVEFVKQVDKAYLARAGAIVDAFDSAATPLVSFLVSGVVAFTDTASLFLIAGILDIVLCIPILFTKILDDVEGKKGGSTEATDNIVSA